MADEQTSTEKRTDLSRVLNLEVPVVVKLAQRSLNLRNVLDLSLGSIIEFDKGHEEPLDLLISNACVGRGETVKVGENFGLRITSVKPPKERLEAIAS